MENPDHTSAPVESCHQDSMYEMKKKMFGGQVHSPSKSFFTPPLRVNVENPDHSSAPVECRRQDSIYEMKKKCLGGMSTHIARVFFTPPLRVNVENPDHTSAPVESCHQDSMYEMKKKMFGGHVHSHSKSLLHSTSPSQRGESRSHISPSGELPSRLYL